MKRLFSFRYLSIYWGHGKLACGILINHKHYLKYLTVFDYRKPLMDDDNDWWHRY